MSNGGGGASCRARTSTNTDRPADLDRPSHLAGRETSRRIRDGRTGVVGELARRHQLGRRGRGLRARFGGGLVERDAGAQQARHAACQHRVGRGEARDRDGQQRLAGKQRRPAFVEVDATRPRLDRIAPRAPRPAGSRHRPALCGPTVRSRRGRDRGLAGSSIPRRSASTRRAAGRRWPRDCVCPPPARRWLARTWRARSSAHRPRRCRRCFPLGRPAMDRAPSPALSSSRRRRAAAPSHGRTARPIAASRRDDAAWLGELVAMVCALIRPLQRLRAAGWSR